MRHRDLTSSLQDYLVILIYILHLSVEQSSGNFVRHQNLTSNLQNH